ncbi:hypothetical protein BAAL111456_23825 [Bacillus albus]|uniref:Uncharacterized protein n=1 Tax=Bacillus albus TaxID=2026189 RepID=A0A1J9UCA1_9BACI|nr:hypothetical protein BAU25_15605 [Bacillus albus]
MFFSELTEKYMYKIPIGYYGRYQIFLWPYFLDITVRLYVSKGKKYFQSYYHLLFDYDGNMKMKRLQPENKEKILNYDFFRHLFCVNI